MPRATVKCFHDAKGYGFLIGADGREVFVHYSAIACQALLAIASSSPARRQAIPSAIDHLLLPRRISNRIPVDVTMTPSV